jgi:hypothetical protein
MSESMGFEAFWDEFLRTHPDAASRAPHVVAAAITVGLAAVGIATRRVALVVAAPVVGYAISTGARLFAGHPVAWPHEALRADLRLLWKTLDGTLGNDVSRASSSESPAAETGPDLDMN